MIPFFHDRSLKRALIGLIVAITIVSPGFSAEPETRLPLTIPRPALGLNAVEKELKSLIKDWNEVAFCVDNVLVRHVSYYVKYYAAVDVDRSNRAIRRSEKYLGFIKQVFKKYNVPEDVAFALPFVESSFEPDALSEAGAVGMFQFIKSTAADYGLKMDGNGNDERRNYKKSAQACARYLGNNRRVFASTILSLGAYHHGTKLVTDVLLTCGDDPQRKFGPVFGDTKLGPFSKEYIPQCLAAALIYRHLKQNKLGALQAPRVESRTLAAAAKVAALKKQVPGLFDTNPDLYHAGATYAYAGTNGYVLLTKLDYSLAGTHKIKTLPQWAQNPEPTAPGDTKVAGSSKTIRYTVQTHNDLPGIAAIFGTNVKALMFINRYLTKRPLLPGDIVEIRGMAPTTQVINGRGSAGHGTLTVKTLKDETLEAFCKRVVKVIQASCADTPWQMGADLTPALIYYWNYDALGDIQPDTPLKKNLRLTIYSDYRWYKNLEFDPTTNMKMLNLKIAFEWKPPL